MWEDETVVRRCDRSKGGVKFVSVEGEVYGGDVSGCGKV